MERLEAVADKAGMTQDDWGEMVLRTQKNWEDDGSFFFLVGVNLYLLSIIVYDVVYFS